jgi:hypothetical protein
MAAALPHDDGHIPTFNWCGVGDVRGTRTHYRCFQLADTQYQKGDYVYLLPEEQDAPMYIARLLDAFEDAGASDQDKLCIEVCGLSSQYCDMQHHDLPL